MSKALKTEQTKIDITSNVKILKGEATLYGTLNKTTSDEDDTTNTKETEETHDNMSPSNIQKETIVLPRISDDVGSASTLRTNSRSSLPEMQSQSPLKEIMSDGLRHSNVIKLPTLVWPEESEDKLTIDTNGQIEGSTNHIKTKQSEIYKEELKTIKSVLKQLSTEGRNLILDYRMKEDVAKKQANEEKKAARKAAKLVEKETSSQNAFVSAAKTVIKSKRMINSVLKKAVLENRDIHSINEMHITDSNSEESTENSEEVVDIDENSVTINEVDTISVDYSVHSTTERCLIKDLTTNVDVNKVGKRAKKLIMAKSRNHITNDPTSREKVVITEGNDNEMVRQTRDKRKKMKVVKKKKLKEDKTKENRNNEREKLWEKKEKDAHDVKNRHKETKNLEEECEDSSKLSLQLPRQTSIDRVEREKFSDLESVSTVINIGLRLNDAAGCRQNKVKDKKWWIERFRVPKEPMEIALQLQKLGFNFESVQLRDIVASKQKLKANLKKAIIKEKKEEKEEQKRIEKELKERERKEAHERKMEEMLAMENRKREQEARKKEERRARAIERRKSNLELLKDMNYSILSIKTSPSNRFSYEPVLPQPAILISPEPEDKSGSDNSEPEEEHAQAVRSHACEHSGRAVCATVDCKYHKYARKPKKKA